jgi:molybdopterin converting factor small subunit
MGTDPPPVVVLRLFAAAREAAGRGHDEVAGWTVSDVLASACERYGEPFAAVLATSRVWVNGNPAEGADAVVPGDEVAVLPPVSGGEG